MKKYVLILILLFNFAASAQTKKPAAKPTPKPSPVVETKQTAPDPTQKVVVEKTNGDRLTGLFVSGDTENVVIDVSGSKLSIKLAEIFLLRFSDEATSPSVQIEPSAQTARAAALEFEGAIIFRNGDAVPIARTAVLLLDVSAVDLMRQAGLRGEGGKTDDQSIIFAMILAGITGKSEVQNFQTLLRQHAKYGTETDFSGKGVIQNIAPGKYYLFSGAEIRKARVIWNLPIEIQEGQTLRIVLDQKNAALAL